MQQYTYKRIIDNNNTIFKLLCTMAIPLGLVGADPLICRAESCHHQLSKHSTEQFLNLDLDSITIKKDLCVRANKSTKVFTISHNVRTLLLQ